jgi:hypothetical protein
MLLLGLLACGGTETIVLTDAQNYAFTSMISADCQTIPAGQDSRVDWSALTADILGNTLDPAKDVDTLQLALFPDLTSEQVLAGINDDTLAQSDVAGFADLQPPDGTTESTLSAFDTMGTPLDVAQIVADGSTYLLNASTQLEDGRVRYDTFTFLCPTATDEAATIALAPDSATLEWTVDLDGAEPIDMLGAKKIIVDWSELTQNGSDLEIDLADIDRMLLARYDEDLAAIEADFLRVEALAEDTWSADVEGWGDWPLSDLESPEGEAFTGFEGDGTWILALQCTTCINPAPPFLGVVTP